MMLVVTWYLVMVFILCSQLYSLEFMDIALGCCCFCADLYMEDFCWQVFIVVKVERVESWGKEHLVIASVTSGILSWSYPSQSWQCKLFNFVVYTKYNARNVTPKLASIYENNFKYETVPSFKFRKIKYDYKRQLFNFILRFWIVTRVFACLIV